MSLRTRVLAIAEIILRVPPLFVIDEILKIGLNITRITTTEANYEEGSSLLIENVDASLNYTADNAADDPRIYQFVLLSLGQILLSSLGCLAALCLFILNMKQLMLVYMYLMSVGIVFVSYWMNHSTMKAVAAALETNGAPQASILEDFLSFNFADLWHENAILVMENLIFQLALLFLFSNLHMCPRHPPLQRLLPFSFLGPTILAMLPVPVAVLKNSAVFAALLPLAFVKFVLWASLFSIIHNIHSGYNYAKNYVANFGTSALIENEWVRLSVPEVLRTFWLLRVLEHTGIFFVSGLWNVDDSPPPAFKLLKNVMITGCDTLVAILGITSVVSYLCHRVGKFFQWILLIEDDSDKGLGAVSAILFYVLALQTGLTGLEPEKRFVRLCRNFCLLFTALLHFLHNIVNPLLMSLSASHNRSVKRHMRALGVCALIVLLPISLMTYLWSNHSVSTWLLAVSAFSVEVIVKVAVSLCIYSLFLLDARTDTFWEGLDDCVYYIKAFGNTVEFCFGIFLFFNGAWILIFESGGAIRAVMMCIHAYFNIWCEAKAGWSVFMKRRTAVNKIESLPEAEEGQLALLDDVCAICYQEMRTAKITKCGHYFHGVCLRKWLYVQDRCPLCHKILHCVDCDNPKADASEAAELRRHVENR